MAHRKLRIFFRMTFESREGEPLGSGDNSEVVEIPLTSKALTEFSSHPEMVKPEVIGGEWDPIDEDKKPDEQPAQAAPEPPNTEGFPGPVWEAAMEIERKRAFPGEPTIDQITETAVIIWVKVRPLYDAALVVFSNPHSILTSSDFKDALKKWKHGS